FDNPITGNGARKVKYDGTGRITVRWAPSSLPITASLSADRTSERDTGTPVALLGYNAPYLDSLVPGVPLATLLPITTGVNPANFVTTHSNFWNTYSDPHSPQGIENTPFSTNQTGGVSLNLDSDLGPLHAKSITGYRQSNSANAEDLDGTPANIG